MDPLFRNTSIYSIVTEHRVFVRFEYLGVLRHCNRVRIKRSIQISPTELGLSFLTAVEDDKFILQRPRFKGPDSSVGRATD